MLPADRAAVVDIVRSVGNFNPAELDCALELVDVYLDNAQQNDYRFVVAEDAAGRVCGYACWGPTPMTRGTHDLYWIATHPEAQGRGVGHRLMRYVEDRVREENGRMLIIETSAKQSYSRTVEFYRSLQYEEASRIRDFYDVGDDKLVFVRRFSP